MSDDGWGKYLVGLGDWESKVADFSDIQTRFSCFIVGMLLRLCDQSTIRPKCPWDVMFMTNAVIRIVERNDELLELVVRSDNLDNSRRPFPAVAPALLSQFCRLEEGVLKLQDADVAIFEFARRSLIAMIELLEVGQVPVSRFDFMFFIAVLEETLSERRALELIFSGEGSRMDWGESVSFPPK